METDHGPFETDDQARMLPEVRAIHEAFRAGTGDLSGERMMLDACEAAGIRLGAYDARILHWVAGFEVQDCAVIAGIIRRAHEAGKAAAAEGTCCHCGQPIRRCPHPAGTIPVCKGWRHEGHDDQLIGAHYCDGRSVNPAAEPATRETREDDGG